MPRSTARLLRRILRTTTEHDPVWRETNEEVARALGLDRSTVVRGVARLCVAGLIEPLSIKGGRGRPSEYVVDRLKAVECLRRGRLPEVRRGRRPRDAERLVEGVPGGAPAKEDGPRAKSAPAASLGLPFLPSLVSVVPGGSYDRALATPDGVSVPSGVPAGSPVLARFRNWWDGQHPEFRKALGVSGLAFAALGAISGALLGGRRNAVLGALAGGVVGVTAESAMWPRAKRRATLIPEQSSADGEGTSMESMPTDVIDWIARSTLASRPT